MASLQSVQECFQIPHQTVTLTLIWNPVSTTLKVCVLANLFFCFVLLFWNSVLLNIAQAGRKLLASRDPPTSTSWAARTAGTSHHAWLFFWQILIVISPPGGYDSLYVIHFIHRSVRDCKAYSGNENKWRSCCSFFLEGRWNHSL